MLERAGFEDYVEDMNKVASKHFGEVELNHGRDHNLTATHELAGQTVELDLNVNAHDHFDEAAMHKVDYRLRFLPELVDQVRKMIAEELDQAAYALFTQDMQTQIDSGMPEEMRWLAMFPKTQLASLKTLRTRYSTASNAAAPLAVWLDKP